MARTLKAIEPTTAKPSKPKILVYGIGGVGKTTVAIDFPKTYLIDCEGGANLPQYTERLKKSGGMYFGPDQGANDFAAVTEEIITLATTKHPFKTIVIDSVSKIFNTAVAAEHERMEKAGRDMEKTFGAEKKPALNWLRRWLRWFEKIDMNVIMVAHQKDQYVEGKLSGTTFDCWEKLNYELHLSLQIIKQGPSRKAKVMKSRLTGFPDADVFDWSYAEFANRFGKDVIESEVTQVQMATPEQIARFNDLMKIVKLDQKVIDKWSDTADNLEDLSTDDMKKRIDYMTALLPKA